MKIKLQTKEKYGTKLYYPVCENADAFTRLLDKHTIPERCFKTIRQLGFSIEIDGDKKQTLPSLSGTQK